MRQKIQKLKKKKMELESNLGVSASPLKTYLDSLASASVNCAQVSQQARQILTQKIASKSIDQLVHEQEKAEGAMRALKLSFAKEELGEVSQTKYAQLC